MDMMHPKSGRPERTRLLALQILANLSLKDRLRHNILQCNGLPIFLGILKKEVNFFETVEAQRHSAKALVNLVSSKRELRLKVVTELSELIRLIYRGEVDEIVATYVQTLLHANEQR
jgi:hypothetical protein